MTLPKYLGGRVAESHSTVSSEDSLPVFTEDRVKELVDSVKETLKISILAYLKRDH